MNWFSFNFIAKFVRSNYISTDVNENLNHFMILDTVAKGVNNIDKIARITKLRTDEVELILNGLSI